MVGDSTVTCTADGSWNGTKPVCLRGIKFSLNTLKRFLRKGESGINDKGGSGMDVKGSIIMKLPIFLKNRRS